VLVTSRARWRGAGARATSAQLCPHCHLSNEQFHHESSARAPPRQDVHSTLSKFDRIMSILAPRRAGGGGAAAKYDNAPTARPRRRAGKGSRQVRTNDAANEQDDDDDADDDDATGASSSLATLSLSRSAPASSGGDGASLLHRAMASGRASTAREDAALREELADVARLGQRRRRRWANDRLLKELGGNMTVAEMAAQFMPPPFGAPSKPSPFEAMLDAQARGEWLGFRRVDMDKEAAFLSRLSDDDAARRRERHRGSRARGAAWSRTSSRCRAALRRASRRHPEQLERLEAALVDFAVDFAADFGGRGSDLSSDADVPALVLPLDDAFARLLAHGLCEYHGLRAVTREGAGGGKEFVARPPPARRAANAANALNAANEAEKEEGETEGETDVEAATEMDDGSWRPPPVTCAQFLRALEASNKRR
jgi:hypothetical protein